MRKRFIALIGVTAIALSMVACSGGSEGESSKSVSESSTETSESASKKDSDIKIGVSFSTLEQERMVREKELFESMASEKGVELVLQSADFDVNMQQSQVENMIAAGIDVLLLYPVDSDSCTKIIDACHKNDVEVIAYDNLANNCDLDYYVSFDSIRVGEIVAEYAMSICPKGNYLLLQGDPSYNNAYLCQTGMWNVIQDAVDSGDITVVAEQFCDGWGSEAAMDYTENALTAADNKIDVVLTSYDGMATGAISALAAQGLAGKVVVTGQDCELSACQRIVEGTQTMSVYKPISELATQAFDLSYAIAKGENVDQMINGTIDNGYKEVDSVMPAIYTVDADSMKEIIIDGGFHTMDEVYANVPKEEWPE